MNSLGNHNMCDYDDKISYLNQAKHINSDIKDISDRLSNLHAECALLRSVTYDKPKVTTSLKTDSLEATAIMLQEKALELSRKLQYLIALKNQIQQAIDDIPDSDARYCLRALYVDGKTIRAYAEEFNYCERTASRIKKKALDLFRIPEGRIVIK